jgi:hypothetical protein
VAGRRALVVALVVALVEIVALAVLGACVRAQP